MGFVKSLAEIAAAYTEKAEFYDAEMLTVFWETKPEIVKRLLPPPLKPSGKPIAFAFVANYPRTNFGVSYLEGALFLRAEFDGEPGAYCLAMPVTNDMAMAGGREIYGYPKKIAAIELKRDGQDVEGRIERRGVRFFEVRAKLTGEVNADEAEAIMPGLLSENGDSVAVCYNFKHFPAPGADPFDYSPRLIREEVELSPVSIEMGEAEIVMKSSDYDPWTEVEIVKLLGAMYTKGNNAMRPGEVVAEVDPAEFAPYAFLKWDM